MNISQLKAALTAMEASTVLCVGDLMIDRFIYGDVSRISPEGPIPVLAHRSQETMLGACGNVARNVASLGGKVVLAAVVGNDKVADTAMDLIAAEPAFECQVVVQPGRATSLKTRFVAGRQQLLRLDVEDTAPIDEVCQRRVALAVASAAEDAGVILLSDYAKGVVGPTVIAACRQAAATRRIPLVVDPKGVNFAKYGVVDVIKPNAAELAACTGMPTRTDAEVEAALEAALARCEAAAILVTRAEQGMSLAVRGEPVRHFRTSPREVFDVSGAGDTSLATLGLALGAGLSLEAAVELAILASGIAVSKAGTAVVTADEMVDAQFAMRGAIQTKIASLEEALEEIKAWRGRRLRIGFTNGCFDILHRGHVAYLAQARSWCDRLIVGLNSDSSIRVLKGEGRPVNDLESRSEVLAALGSVDLIIPFSELTPVHLIEAIRPDVLIKGADYSPDQVVGAELLTEWGGELRLADMVPGASTTATLNKLSGSR